MTLPPRVRGRVSALIAALGEELAYVNSESENDASQTAPVNKTA